MAGDFQVILLPRAEKELRKFSWGIEKKMLATLQLLRTFPFLKGRTIKKFKTAKTAHYELKEADHRIIFRVEEKKILIKMIIHRKDLERELKRI